MGVLDHDSALSVDQLWRELTKETNSQDIHLKWLNGVSFQMKIPVNLQRRIDNPTLSPFPPVEYRKYDDRAYNATFAGNITKLMCDKLKNKEEPLI